MINLIKSKKAGHVGMILSFVIFITFIVFLYSVVQPVTEIERGKQDLLEYLHLELLREFSEDMTTSTVSINDTVAETCIRFEMVEGTDHMNVVVRTDKILLEHEKSGSVEGSLITIDRQSAEGTEDFFKVYYSDEFESTETESPCLNPKTLTIGEDYVLGLVRTEEEIFESKIQKIVQDFEANYTEIKDKLNIAPGNEFGFSFTNVSEDTSGTPEKNVSVNIYVEEIPIQYIDSEANIKPGYLNIRVW